MRGLFLWETIYRLIQQTLVRLNDPYTRFLPPQAYRQLLLQTQGQQVDVGRELFRIQAIQWWPRP